ncbi:MAG TPA: CopG family transcriptional regulator [Dehalococcoidia bacterium]|nr:CopG family transcriptional regulator [Dehalococcoidia bacterium]
MAVDGKKRPGTKTPAYEKLAITLPRELAQAVRREAKERHAPSLSAYFAEKMAEVLERDRLFEILDEMDARYGPPDLEAVAWAKEVLFGE